MAVIRSYRAEMVGLSERDRTLLRSFLAASQSRTGSRWDGGPNQPQVWFIDIDSQTGADFWQSLPEGERRDGAVVISSGPPSEAVRWLPKPLRSVSLLGVLEQMTLPVRVAAPAAPAEAGSAAAAARGRHPNEPLRLLDVFEEAATSGARVVQSAHWPDLVLGGGNTHAMRTAPIEQYIEGFAASTEVARVVKYTGGPLDDELRIDLDTLRWLALVHAPLAEIERRMQRPERARLRALPPFGQLPHSLQQVRIAAWLVQHPASPQELAETTGVDEETVLRFIAACDALGLMQEIAEVVQPPAVPAPIEAPTVREAVVAAAQPAPEAEPEAEARPEPMVADVPAEALSVLERLRATREQNRARVAAAIRSVSGN